MEALKELQKWVQSLSKGEKRNIKLLGKSRSGITQSQHLELFDWLNTETHSRGLQPEAAILHNFHTVSARLKSLILDSLRLQHQDADTESKITADLDGARQLTRKKLYPAALRLLAQAKSLAWKTSRYSLVLACIEQERMIARAQLGGDFLPTIEALSAEEARGMQHLAVLQQLLLHYDRLRTQTQQTLITPRQPSLYKALKQSIDEALLTQLSQTGNYLEQALAVNVLGIHDLFERDTLAAMQRYQRLLAEWNKHPEWQRDQGQLLYNISIMYQIACVNSPLSLAELQAQLAYLPDFKVFTPDIAIEFQSSLFLNQLVIGLNTGQLDWVESIIPELDRWLRAEEGQLAARLILAFLHNFSIVAFINGQHAAAYGFVRRILQVPHPKARKDIREFALVFQAVLQIELGEMSLSESLIRAGKRYFKYCGRDWEFERLVYQFLEKQSRGGDESANKTALLALDAALEGLQQAKAGAMPILGLTEMRIFIAAKQKRVPMRAVFLETIQANLAQQG
jgi:hypothetical protein